VLLLPLDVAARRLQLTRRDWERAWGRIRNYELGIRNEEGAAEPERVEGMARLLRAKEKKSEELGIRNYELGMERKETVEAVAPTSSSSSMEAPSAVEATADVPADVPPVEEEPLAARLRKRRNL
jgi:hypothetical protein